MISLVSIPPGGRCGARPRLQRRRRRPLVGPRPHRPRHRPRPPARRPRPVPPRLHRGRRSVPAQRDRAVGGGAAPKAGGSGQAVEGRGLGLLSSAHPEPVGLEEDRRSTIVSNYERMQRRLDLPDLWCPGRWGWRCYGGWIKPHTASHVFNRMFITLFNAEHFSAIGCSMASTLKMTYLSPFEHLAVTLPSISFRFAFVTRGQGCSL